MGSDCIKQLKISIVLLHWRVFHEPDKQTWQSAFIRSAVSLMTSEEGCQTGVGVGVSMPMAVMEALMTPKPRVCWSREYLH